MNVPCGGCDEGMVKDGVAGPTGHCQQSLRNAANALKLGTLFTFWACHAGMGISKLVSLRRAP